MGELLSFVTDSDVAKRIKEKGFGEFVLRCANAQYDSFVKYKLANYDNQELAEKLSDVLISVADSKKEIRKGFNSIRETCKNIDEKVNMISKLGMPLTALNTGLSFVNLASNIAGTYILSEKVDQLGESLSIDLGEIKADTRRIYQAGIDEFKLEYEKIMLDISTLVESIQDEDELKKENYTDVIKEIKLFVSWCVMGVLDDTLPFELVIGRIKDLLPVYTELLAKYQIFYHEKQGKAANIKRYKAAFDDVLQDRFIAIYKDYLFLDAGENYADILDIVETFEASIIWQGMFLQYNKELLEILSADEYSALEMDYRKYVQERLKGVIPEAAKAVEVLQEQVFQLLELQT